MRTFTISRNDLLAALLRCQHAIDRRAVIPEMQNYQFSFSLNRLLVSATDGEVFMQESLAMDVNEDTEGVAFSIDRSYLLSAIKSLDEQPLTFKLMDYQVEVVHSRGWFYLKKFDGVALLEDCDRRNAFDFYVNKFDHPVVNRISLEIPGIKHWIELSYNSLASDVLRPVMNCVCLDFMGDNYMQIAASDGHQLTVIKKIQDGADFNAKLLVPRKVCKIIQKCLPKTGMMDLAFTEYKYEKEVGTEKEHKQKAVGAFTVCLDEKDANHTLFVRFRDAAMDGHYPNYQSVIPPTFTYFLEFDRISLLKSVNRLMHFSNDSGMLVFNFNPNKMTISAECKDFEMGASEELPCELTSPVFEEPELKVGFKGCIIASLLKRMVSERVLMSFRDSIGACIMEPQPQPDVEDLTFLIRPMLCD
jgi:DNA polymerase-3 subunit beta